MHVDNDLYVIRITAGVMPVNSAGIIVWPEPIRSDGVIVDGPNRGARSWDVHAARSTTRTK